MRRWWLVLLVACTGDDVEVRTGQCVMWSRVAAQAHGTCRIESDACPRVVGAACGNESDCPDGWALTCEPSPEDPEIGINCTYGGTCSPDTHGTVSFDYVQTIDDMSGVIVMPDPTTPGRCEFRPCI